MSTNTDTKPVITPRGVELPSGAGIPVNARELAVDLLRRAKSCVLSTLDPASGYPLGSVTNIATMSDGTPFFFAAMLTVHARNVTADSRAALTMAQLGKGDALVQPRLGLVGRVEMLEGDLTVLQQRYLRRHPKGKLYLALPDARMFKMVIEGVHLGAGPGRNAARLTPADMLTDLTGAEELVGTGREPHRRDQRRTRYRRASLLCPVDLEPGRWKGDRHRSRSASTSSTATRPAVSISRAASPAPPASAPPSATAYREAKPQACGFTPVVIGVEVLEEIPCDDRGRGPAHSRHRLAGHAPPALCA